MEKIILFTLTMGILIHFLYREYLIRNIPKKAKGGLWKVMDFLVFVVIPLIQIWYNEVGRVKILDNSIIQLIGLALFITGICLSFWGKYTLGKLWVTGWEYQIKKDHEIIKSGPFQYFKHPIYVGVILIAAGFELALSNIFVIIVLFVVIPLFAVQAKKEEKLLTAHFGNSYLEFKKNKIL